MPAIPIDDFVRFAHRSLSLMDSALDRLNDHNVNERPAPGRSSPCQLVTHALGSFGYWTGHIVAGLPTNRDRPSEFEASATLDELRASIAGAHTTVDSIADRLGAASELANEGTTNVPLDGEWTVGAALMHAYEELVQHLGHLEVTIDALVD